MTAWRLSSERPARASLPALNCVETASRRFVSFLLLAGFIHLALLSIWNIPLFMIVAAPPVGLALVEWLRRLQQETSGSSVHRALGGFNSLSRRLTAADAGPRWHVVCPAVVLMLGAAMYGHSPPPAFQ